MIDLEEEMKRMEKMLERREIMALGVTCKEMIELITRLREAEKDAARYRWLRDELEQSQGGIALFDGCDHVCDIGLFIDEAMNASNN